MSVYTNKTDYRETRANECIICDGPLRAPFFEWNAKFVMCGKCVHKIKNGLIADLIHLAAIIDLQKLYPNQTFIRKNTTQYEKSEIERHRLIEHFYCREIKKEEAQ